MQNPSTNGHAPFDPSAYKDGVLDEIKLDEFEIPVSGGRKLRPHVGESVWLMPYGMSIEEELQLEQFVREASAESADEQKIEARLDQLCALLVRLIVGWSITDNFGKPYPQPDSAQAVKVISSRLLMYLMAKIKGDEPEGNALSA